MLQTKRTWKKYLSILSWINTKETESKHRLIVIFNLVLIYLFMTTALLWGKKQIFFYVLALLPFIEIIFVVIKRKDISILLAQILIKIPAYIFCKKELGFYFSVKSLDSKEGEKQKEELHKYLCKKANKEDIVKFWNMYNLIDITFPSILLDGKNVLSDYMLLQKLIVLGYKIPIPKSNSKELKVLEYQVVCYFSSIKMDKIINLQKNLFIKVQSKLKAGIEVTQEILKNSDEYDNYIWEYKSFLSLFEGKRPSLWSDVSELTFHLLENKYLKDFIIQAKTGDIEDFEKVAITSTY